MANKNPKQENLLPFNELTEKEQRKICSKGGKKSGEVRRTKKTMKEMLNYLLEKEIENKKGEKATTLEAISVSMIKQALSGNVKAFEIIRDTIGEKTPDTVVNINQAVQVNKNDIEEAVNIINELR